MFLNKQSGDNKPKVDFGLVCSTSIGNLEYDFFPKLYVLIFLYSDVSQNSDLQFRSGDNNALSFAREVVVVIF